MNDTTIAQHEEHKRLKEINADLLAALSDCAQELDEMYRDQTGTRSRIAARAFEIIAKAEGGDL